jgi:NTP pyrophosphatase (non-canonical NTP hydrolase)
MTFDEYERERAAAFGEPLDGYAQELTLGSLGLTGESGEVAELVKKYLFHGKPLDRDKLIKELGDVLWYVMYTARAAGSSLEEVARVNNAKLRERYPNGFSVEAAATRAVEP